MSRGRLGTGEQWVSMNGIDVLLRQHGEGRPVLLINGIGSHTAMWAPLEHEWSDLRTISFDAPGVGRSSTKIPPPSIEGLAELVEGLIDHLGLDHVDVVGYSLGGTVAQTLARRVKNRVGRLVLVATMPGMGYVPGGWTSMVHVYNPFRYFFKGYYKRSIGAMAGGQARTNVRFIEDHGNLRQACRPNIFGYYAQIAALCTWSSIRWLEEIGVPTLVVAGGDDPMMPLVNSFILAHRIPQARLIVSPNDGHLLLFDRGSPVIDDIHEFLSAPTVAESATWGHARQVTREQEAEMLHLTTPGMFPWGYVSAAYRGMASPNPGHS